MSAGEVEDDKAKLEKAVAMASEVVTVFVVEPIWSVDQPPNEATPR